MRTKFILALLIAAFSLAGISNSNAAEVRSVKSSSSKSLFVPGPQGERVYQQGRHRWHRMHRRHAHERVRRHHARRMHHREYRHRTARHYRRHY